MLYSCMIQFPVDRSFQKNGSKYATITQEKSLRKSNEMLDAIAYSIKILNCKASKELDFVPLSKLK